VLQYESRCWPIGTSTDEIFILKKTFLSARWVRIVSEGEFSSTLPSSKKSNQPFHKRDTVVPRGAHCFSGETSYHPLEAK
jgi:hypothetical protein